MDSDPELFGWERGIEFYGKADPHKVAIMFADKIVGVSPQYVQEILAGDTPHPASLYQGILQTRLADVLGILNGLPDDFGPKHYFDQGVIPAKFSPDDLTGRRLNRRFLQRELNLPVDDDAMIAVWSSRIAMQKGIDLVVESLPKILKRIPSLQLVFIGDGDEAWIDKLGTLMLRYPQNIRYSEFIEDLEILALAGGDILLMPSKYEPCGLNQMKAHKLGCVPVVHQTGGLIDTVTDGETGFTFWGLTQDNLVGKMEGTWEAFQHPEYWTAMVRRIMTLDYSWTTRAGEYEALYREVIAQHAR